MGIPNAYAILRKSTKKIPEMRGLYTKVSRLDRRNDLGEIVGN